MVKVASVGLGWVTNHRHLPTLDASRDFQVVGVIDRAPGKARDVARMRGYPHHAQVGSLTEVDWLSDVDAVIIGTPPMSHYALAREALILHKHVLVEKPFAMNVEEGDALRCIAQEQGLTLAIVHNFQFARSMKALLADLQSNRLGKVRSIRAIQLSNPRRRLPVWYDQLPFGLFYDESPHLMYLMRRVAGAPLSLMQCDIVRGAKNTPIHVNAVYRSSVPVYLQCDFESPVSEWYLEVLAEEGIGIVDLFRDIYVHLPNDGLHVTSTVLRTSIGATWQHWSQHVTSGLQHLRGTLSYGNRDVFARFADSVKRHVQPEFIGPDDAIAILKMQHELIGASKALW